MPAHLESTDRAMKIDKARIRQIRKSRKTSQEDQDGSEHDMSQDEEAHAAVSAKTRSTAWRARVNAAVTLKNQGIRKKHESGGVHVRTIGTIARDGNRQEGGMRAE